MTDIKNFYKVQIFDGDMTMTYHIPAVDIYRAELKAIDMHSASGYRIEYIHSELEYKRG
jgi:hypothetical protein